MPRDEFSEMRAFLEVARERSFTRAAARLGVTRSALSHAVRALEERLGVRLLARTTRDVAPTAAGERLVESIAPHFESIAAEISALGALRDKPSGHIRIVCPDDAIDMVFRPRLQGVPARLPGHRRGAHRRQRLHQHRRAPVRCRRAARRSHRARHGGRSRRRRCPLCRRWLARLLRTTFRAGVLPGASPATIASTCGFRHQARFTLGSSRRTRASSPSAWRPVHVQ